MPETIQKGTRKGGYKIRPGARGGCPIQSRKEKRKAAMNVDLPPEGECPILSGEVDEAIKVDQAPGGETKGRVFAHANWPTTKKRGKLKRGDLRPQTRRKY